MDPVITLMRHAHAVKHLPRTGWNMEFPEGHNCKTRSVNNPETVGSHKYGAVFLSLITGASAGVNRHRVMELLVVHDLVEGVKGVGDRVVATEFDAEKASVIKAEKARAEQEGILEIANDSGVLGYGVKALWDEFEANETPEAKFANQIDKLEACIQAYLYQAEGKQVCAMEFISSSRPSIYDPELVRILDHLEELCK